MAQSPDWLLGTARHTQADLRIRRAARAVLLERGPERFTAEAVAARAGCSRATLYRTLGGKKALLDAVILDGASDVVEEIRRRTAHLDGPDRVVEVILVAVESIRADAALYRWFSQYRTAAADELLVHAIDIAAFTVTLAGIPEPNDLDAEWLLRIVLSLLAWPLRDRELERQLVETFLRPAYEHGGRI